jgi:cytochrome c
VKRVRQKSTPAALMSSALALSGALLLYGVHVISVSAQGQDNDGPPIVKITAPKNNTTYSWKSLVNYSIVVTYQGKSTQYEEIPSKEVLLKTAYVSDLSAMVGTPAPTAVPIPTGLLYITNSTCLGCHQFKAKAMGPSFAAIGERYPTSQATIDTLSQHIRGGSTGVWGQGTMPPQMQFTEDQLHAIVGWIMNDAANPKVNYYVGTEGTFRMDTVGPPDSKGGMILTASYVGQAASVNPEQAPHGEDTVIVHGK